MVTFLLHGNIKTNTQKLELHSFDRTVEKIKGLTSFLMRLMVMCSSFSIPAEYDPSLEERDI